MILIYELLNAQVRLGMITLEQRDQLLAEMSALLEEERTNESRGRDFLKRDTRTRLQGPR